MTVDPFSLELASPLATAEGSIERREGFVVQYEHRGHTGFGEATPLPGWTESRSACRVALSDALDTAARDGHASALLDLEVADVPAARHGFTTALYDADARAETRPLYRWFDQDRHCESVPVNATIGDGSVSETVSAGRRAADDGFDCLKLKVGNRSLQEDLERVRAVRSAVGGSVTIRLDANGAWSRETASRAFDAVADFDVRYVEQPLPADDLCGLASLAGGGVEVAVDESLLEEGLGTVLSADAADVVVLKPMALGGLGDAYTLAMRAQEAGLAPVVSTTVDGVVARTGAVHVAAAIPECRPCGLATAGMLAEDLGPDPAPVTDGRITVPQSPGIGVTEMDTDE